MVYLRKANEMRCAEKKHNGDGRKAFDEEVEDHP